VYYILILHAVITRIPCTRVLSVGGHDVGGRQRNPVWGREALIESPHMGQPLRHWIFHCQNVHQLLYALSVCAVRLNSVARNYVACIALVVAWNTGRFAKREQWEHWRGRRKLASGSEHRRGDRLRCWGWVQEVVAPHCGGPPTAGVHGYHLWNKFQIVYAKSCNLVYFWPENGSQRRP